MRSATWKQHVRVIAVGLTLGTLLGCGDLLGADRGAPVVEEPGIYPTLVVAEQGNGVIRVELMLRRVQMAEDIAAYQGEITYDRARMELSAARVPAEITGLWNETGPGRIRFAGVKLDGVGESSVLVLEVATSADLTADDFTVTLSEISAVESLSDVTAHLSPARPLLVRAGSP